MDEYAADAQASLPGIPGPKRRRLEPVFPIVEAFGYQVGAGTAESQAALDRRWCRFAGTPCEKFRQYKAGYCAVTYAAADDGGVRRTYAVCDHRLDGEPVWHAVRDHFGRTDGVELAAEVSVGKPRRAFDYAAFTHQGGEVDDLIVIETQTIDMRGGGVMPAWQALLDGKPEQWRQYFTKDAAERGRRDTVAYGVNMANIYKRLGSQIVFKGVYLKDLGIPLYVVMQDRPYRYLRRRIAFPEAPDGAWDITFVTFDYTGAAQADGSLQFTHRATERVRLADFIEAMAANADTDPGERRRFLDAVKRKSRLG